MRFVWGAIYLLLGGIGAAFTRASAGRLGMALAAFAVVNFYLAWGKAVGGGLLVRILHALMGFLIVLAWFVSAVPIVVLLVPALRPHVLSDSFGLGMAVMLLTGVAAALTPVVVLYGIDFAKWWKRRRAPTTIPGLAQPGMPRQVGDQAPSGPLPVERRSNAARPPAIVGVLVWAACLLLAGHSGFLLSLLYQAAVLSVPVFFSIDLLVPDRRLAAADFKHPRAARALPFRFRYPTWTVAVFAGSWLASLLSGVASAGSPHVATAFAVVHLLTTVPALDSIVLIIRSRLTVSGQASTTASSRSTGLPPALFAGALEGPLPVWTVVASWFYVLLATYTVLPQVVGPFRIGDVVGLALLMTVPAVSYIAGQLRWGLASAEQRSGSAAGEARRGPEPTVPSSLGPTSGKVRPAGSRRRIGFVLLVLILSAFAFRIVAGDDLFCHNGAWDACKAVAQRSVRLRLWNESPCRFDAAWNDRQNEEVCGLVAERYTKAGDTDGAIRIYDQYLARANKEIRDSSQSVENRLWNARNELLIKTHADDRIGAIGEEACGTRAYRFQYCASLVRSLAGAGKNELAVGLAAQYCSLEGDAPCRGITSELTEFAKRHLSQGDKAQAIDLLRRTCARVAADSCLDLFRTIEKESPEEAHDVMQSACRRDASTCIGLLKLESHQAPRYRARADALEVCALSPADCLEASRVLQYWVRDVAGARQVLGLMVDRTAASSGAMAAGDGPPPAGAIALSTGRGALRFVESGPVETRFELLRGVLRMHAVVQQGEERGKVLADRTVHLDLDDWRWLDRKLRELDVWTWAPILDPGNYTSDGPAWMFDAGVGTDSFGSMGYRDRPKGYDQLKAALTELAETPTPRSAISR